jgi:hypothetical protein
MVSVSVPGMYGWGNPSFQLLGALGSSPDHRRGLGALFLWATASLRHPLVNKDKAPKTARCSNDQGQCWACPMGWARCCQVAGC